jgi:hypothetical protein
MENYRRKNFCPALNISSPRRLAPFIKPLKENYERKNFGSAFNISSPRMSAPFVKPSFERPKVWSSQIYRKPKDNSMIHVCFVLHDKTGRYSKFTGTTMLSLFDNIVPPPHPNNRIQ